MTTILEIDGSFGEGGGQTLRIATSFSIIFGRPIRVTRVRAGRRIPGLRPQHAATLKILHEICGGTLQGAEVGSTEFTFAPGRPESRSVSLDMGTAASITLVLQALVPAVSLSGVALEIKLTGGTDVPWSPTSDYMSAVLSPCLARAGIVFSLEVTRRGYYPSGGGRARIRIEPCREVRPLDLSTRGLGAPVSVISRAGMLPKRVPEEQLASAISELARDGISPGVTEVHLGESLSPGSSILVSAVGESCFLGSDSIGARGVPAFKVGAHAASRFARIYTTGACVDPNLADMLAPLLCLASGPSTLLTSEVTEHLRTSIHVAKQFVGADYSVEPRGHAQLLTIRPNGSVSSLGV